MYCEMKDRTPKLEYGVRLVLFVTVVAVACGAARADRKKDRAADSYRAVFAEGSEVVGKSIDRWENYKLTSVGGKRLFDAGRPARFVRSPRRRIASPQARVVLVNGDVVPGRIIGIERAEDIPGRPVCLRLMSSAWLRNGRMPKAGIPISPRYVSRVVTGNRSARRSRPGTVLLQSGSLISCQAMKWTPSGLSVLTGAGLRTCGIKDLAEACMQQRDPIARIIDDALAPCPQPGGLVATLTTVDGARITFRPAMMQLREKQLVIQPVWSSSAILLRPDYICRLSIRRYDEIPLSMLPAETLAEKAFTGFVWRWRRDRSVRGGPLVCGSLLGDFGVGTHAYSAIAFDLPRSAKSISFHAGLDKSVGSGGCVRLKVSPDKLDARPLWTSGFVRGGAKPLSVRDLNCSAARRLVLITEFAHKNRPAGADPFDIRDEVNWIMPVVKMNPEEMVRRYGGVLQFFPGLSGWSPAAAPAGDAKGSAKWDNTDIRWSPGIMLGSSGLDLRRKVRVTYSTASLWASGTSRNGSQEISLWIDGKQVKCASGRSHLSTAGDARGTRWSLQSHLGKDVMLTLKIRPAGSRKGSELTRPEIWFTREPVIIPTSQEARVTWRYTTKDPGKGWRELNYDDSSWATGQGMFAAKGSSGMRTEWPTKDIWLRKEFNLPELQASDMLLTVRHDDGAEAYINGVLAGVFLQASWKSYKTVSVTPKARAALKVGKNVIAVHCNDVGGQRYIDVGLIDGTQSSSDDPHVVSRSLRYLPQLADGMVRVLGKHAQILGRGSARYDQELNAIAYWWRGKTWFSWDVDKLKAGKYVVQLTYGCLSRAAGSTYEISVGDQKVSGVVRATGRWATFTTDDGGVVEFKKRGPAKVSIRLLKTPGDGIMTLHAVTLVPIK